MPRHRTRSLIPLLAITALTTGAGACGSPDRDADQPIDDASRARVVAAGDSVASILATTLSGQLFDAIAHAGPAHAISFCSEEARAMADSVALARGAGWEVKRTTRRTRNPANAPDALEREALDQFHAAESGDALEHLVQRTPDGDFRYYRPLRTAPLCLECHGPREDLDADVRQVIDRLYPEDQATGYGPGELRGLIRVTVPAS